MTRGGFLTRETAQRLGDVLRGLKARVGALEGRSESRGDSVQRDDLYIAIPQDNIDAATITPTLITPSSGLCDLFKWNGTALAKRGTVTVYNFRPDVIPSGDPTAIHREWSSGKFFAVGVCCDQEAVPETLLGGYTQNLAWWPRTFPIDPDPEIYWNFQGSGPVLYGRGSNSSGDPPYTNFDFRYGINLVQTANDFLDQTAGFTKITVEVLSSRQAEPDPMDSVSPPWMAGISAVAGESPFATISGPTSPPDGDVSPLTEEVLFNVAPLDVAHKIDITVILREIEPLAPQRIGFIIRPLWSHSVADEHAWLIGGFNGVFNTNFWGSNP